MASGNKDYYAILGLPPTCSDDELKAQYRSLARVYHPDVNPGDEERSTARLRDLNEAYEVLSDPVKRRQFDLSFDRPMPRQATDSATSTPHPASAPDVPTWNPYIGAVSEARRRSERGLVGAALLAGVIVVILISRMPDITSSMPNSRGLPTAGPGPSGDSLPPEDPESGASPEEAKAIILNSLDRTMTELRPQISSIYTQGEQFLNYGDQSISTPRRQAAIEHLREDLQILRDLDAAAEADVQRAHTLDITGLRQSRNRFNEDVNGVSNAARVAAEDIRELTSRVRLTE